MPERSVPQQGDLHITVDRDRRSRIISIAINPQDYKVLEGYAYDRYVNYSIGDSEFASMDYWDSSVAVSLIVAEAFRLEQLLADGKLLMRAPDGRGYRTLIGVPGAVPDRLL